MSSALRVICASFRIQLKDRIASRTMDFTLLVQPVLLAILTVGLYRFGGKANLELYAVIGSGMIGIWNANLWTSGLIVESERREGTLEHILASPTSLRMVLVGKSLSNSVVSLLALFLAFVTGAVVYRVPLGIRDPWAFLGGLVLTVVAMTCLGLVIGTLFVLTRAAYRLTQMLNYPIFVLSGLAFPITVLPAWTRPISVVLAPTWGSSVLERAVGLSSPSILTCLPGTYWSSYLVLIMLAITYYLVASWLLRSVERAARRSGSLHTY